ncbi:MAG: ATP-binding cassette domain-containing protein [Firmicutes bacterium]|nr:ATP-binding cassette domain-containing protein [Bacillota bacterium]
MILSVEGGCYKYPKTDRQILQDVSFELDAGQLLAILGPNGAGKTTLLRCIMGLLKWDAGRSLLEGRDIRRIPNRELWQTVAYVPQARQTTAIYTTEEMILLGRSSRFGLLSQPSAADMAVVERVMERLRISHLAGCKCSRISGGELQMVLIAKALAAEPRVLVLDEPESNLDFRNQLLILDTVSQLTAEGLTCVFNTHYPAHALQRADRALLLSRGGSFRFGPTAQVVTEAHIEETFGVRAVIGEIETPERVLRDVIPLELSSAGTTPAGDPEKRSIAAIAVITSDFDQAEEINRLLHEYGDHIIGRMGLPYRHGGVHVITVTLDAPAGRAEELVTRLDRLPGVSVKATYAGDKKEEQKRG